MERKDDVHGTAEFCDLGNRPVDVTVGRASTCNQVSVHRVPVVWNRPYLLTVVYDSEACRREEHAPPPTPSCNLLFRVEDGNGTWINGATIEMSSPQQYELTTDEYGRADVVSGANDILRGTVRVAGYRSTSFTASCSGSQDPQEKYVQLARP